MIKAEVISMKKQHVFTAPDSEFRGRVSLYWNRLSRTERQIAEYILKDEHAASRLSIQALAEDAGVGAASIVRFSRTLGFKGFSDLKMTLEKDKLLLENRDIGVETDDPINVVKQKVLRFNQSALERCILDSNNETLKQITDSVCRAEKVLIFGCGTASAIAEAGAALFMSTGVMALSVSDSMLQLRSAAFLKPGDVVFALCYTGYSKDVGDAMMFAREAGAVTVLITSAKNSLLGKYADFELHTIVREQANPLNNAATSISQLLLLQTVQVLVHQRKIPAVAKRSSSLRGHSEMKYYDVRQTSIHRGRALIAGEKED